MRARATVHASHRPLAVVVTCEHGGNRIPTRYRRWFQAQERVLRSHRGYDAGALAMAGALARKLDAALVTATVSRLLVELNRSPGHRDLFSSSMHAAPATIRDEVYRRYYLPYRTQVERTVSDAIARGHRVLHISSHSFTPRLDGATRRADVALLYDPSRRWEVELCARWRGALREAQPTWIIRRNYPYRGVSDGFTRYLRKRFGDPLYAGIELEINQKHVGTGTRAWSKTRARIATAIAGVVADEG